MKKKTITLSIETSVGSGSLSIFRGEKELDSQKGKGVGSRAESLIREVSLILKENNLKKSEIDTIVVSFGFGSSTGRRIGLSFAKGLARSIPCEVQTVSLTKSLCLAFEGKGLVRVFIPNGKRGVCFQDFEKINEGQTLERSEPKICKFEDFLEIYENGFENLIFEQSLFERFSGYISSKKKNILVLVKPLSFYVGKYSFKTDASDNEPR